MPRTPPPARRPPQLPSGAWLVPAPVTITPIIAGMQYNAASGMNRDQLNVTASCSADSITSAKPKAERSAISYTHDVIPQHSVFVFGLA